MKKIRNIKRKGIIIICSIMLLTGVFLYWQNNDIVIEEFEFKSDKVSADNDNFKILQVSDLHNKSFGKDNEKLIEKVKNEKPDIIVITGDIVDGSTKELDLAKVTLQQLVEITTVYYVNGNHELSNNKIMELETILADCGVKDLRYLTEIINDSLVIAGIGEEAFYMSEDLKQTCKSILENNQDINEDALKVFLAHEPQFIEEYTDYDIVFSGHAHGGQFRIPFTDISFVAPGQGFFPKYTSGEYTNEDTTMYVSRGLGNSIIPFRVFNRPHIITVTLKCNG